MANIKLTKLDSTYLDTWNTRANKLSGMTYAQYLLSNEWKELKKKASKRSRLKTCYVCGLTDRLELHHMSYNTIGSTDLRNIRAVCRDCHQKIHDHAIKSHKSVRLATRYIRKQYKNTSSFDIIE